MATYEIIDDDLGLLRVNKFEYVEWLAEKYGWNYDSAFDEVYGLFGDPEETDDAI